MGLFALTPRAKEELAALSAHPDNRGKGVRVFVEGMPQSEKTCWILFESKPRAVDRLFVEDGLTMIVGPESAWYMKGKELDFEEDAEGGAFFLTPMVGFEETYDSDEWAFLVDLPAEEEPWDDDEWELVADDESEPRRAPPSRSGGDRLPRGWRPSP